MAGRKAYRRRPKRVEIESPRSKGSARKATPRKTAERHLRLAIATQPALFRDVLSRLLSGEPDIQVVGEARDEDQTVEVIGRVGPPLLVFDYEAMGPNSESIISRLRRAAPETRILVIATRSTDENLERVLRAGASGLVGKQLDFETLLRAIRAVAAGEVWANRRTTALTLQHLTDFPSRISSSEGQLTKRERQIVDGVVRGLRNKEIARLLNISEKTVKSHLNNIFQKLRLEGRFALALFEQQIQSKT